MIEINKALSAPQIEEKFHSYSNQPTAGMRALETIKTNQQFWIPQLQTNLDKKMGNDVAKHNKLIAEITDVTNKLQKVGLEFMRNEDSKKLDTIKADYLKAFDGAKELLPSHAKGIIPISFDNSNPKEIEEKIQYQIEYLQLLCNTEQTKETNLLDLSLKNYFAISNTLSDIAKTVFGFIKHILGNSTGR